VGSTYDLPPKRPLRDPNWGKK